MLPRSRRFFTILPLVAQAFGQDDDIPVLALERMVPA